MENKHPHRVAIEYLASLLDTQELLSENVNIKIHAAEAILRTDYYAWMPPEEPPKPTILEDVSDEARKLVDQGLWPAPFYTPDKNIVLDPATDPTLLSRYEQGKTNSSFGDGPIEHIDCPPDSMYLLPKDQPRSIEVEQFLAETQTKCEAFRTEDQINRNNAAEIRFANMRGEQPNLSPSPMSDAMKEAVEITNDVALGKAEQPWADRVAEKLTEAHHLGYDYWVPCFKPELYCFMGSVAAGRFTVDQPVFYIEIKTACKAVGEEVPKPKMKTADKRQSIWDDGKPAEPIGSRPMGSGHWIGAVPPIADGKGGWEDHNLECPTNCESKLSHDALRKYTKAKSSEIVNDYMKQHHNKYPSPGAVEAVKTLDDARYNGSRWKFAWKPDDALETRNHHPNPRTCHCIFSFPEDAGPAGEREQYNRSRISEDEAIYLAEKIKKSANLEWAQKIVDGVAEAAKMNREFAESQKKQFHSPVLTEYGDRPPVDWNPEKRRDVANPPKFERIANLSEPMTLERAVEILNEKKYCGLVWAACTEPGNGCRFAATKGSYSISRSEFEAIAIAEKLERESK